MRLYKNEINCTAVRGDITDNGLKLKHTH